MMFDKSYFRKCNSCGKDFARSAKVCPFCGKNLNSGLLLNLIIGIGILAIIGAFAIPKPKGSKNYLQMFADAPVDQIESAEIAKIFTSRNKNMNNSIESRGIKITGKIVQWELEVFVVTRSSDYYKIVTTPTFDAPGTLLTLYPQNNQQTIYLDNIRPGNKIKIKGKISGTQQGRIKINPAVII